MTSDDPVAQVKRHDWGMIASLCFLDDVRPPAIENIGKPGDADVEHRPTEWLRVHPHDATDSKDQRRKCPDQRPDAGGQDVIFVVLGTGHEVLFPVRRVVFKSGD
jgi:hypothetical protein